MSDALINSLQEAIKHVRPPSGNINSYSPVRRCLKKYKGDLVVFNESTQELNYY